MKSRPNCDAWSFRTASTVGKLLTNAGLPSCAICVAIPTAVHNEDRRRRADVTNAQLRRDGRIYDSRSIAVGHPLIEPRARGVDVVKDIGGGPEGFGQH